MRKAFILILTMLAIVLSVGMIAIADDNATGRVVTATPAYLEPEESEAYLAGYFYKEGNVKILNELENGWVNIEYMYDPSVLAGHEGEPSTKEPMTVYVKKANIQEAFDAQQTVNALVSWDDLNAYYGNMQFNPELLVDMQYKPLAYRKTGNEIEYTVRTKTTGKNADNRDMLLIHKNQPYVNNTKFIYTPEIRLHDEIYYPLNDLSYNLPLTEAAPAYKAELTYINDQNIAAGLAEILRNSPPYKVYTGYTDNYVNSSRTAASIAILAYMTSVNDSNYVYDLYNGIEAYNTSQFSADYFTYAYWLYEKAVKAYTNQNNKDTLYISYDIVSEPECVNGNYNTSVRVVTNCETGWRISKSSLGTSVVKIEGAEENSDYYTGGQGATVITIVTGTEQDAIELPIYYDSDEPVVVYAVPDDEEKYPVLASLTKQDEYSPAKTIQVSFPELAELTFKVYDEETGSAINEATIELTGDNGNRYTAETKEGAATLNCVPGTYQYRILNMPRIYENAPDGVIDAQGVQEQQIPCARRQISATIEIVNAFTNEVIPDACSIEMLREGAETVYSGVLENGTGKVDGLTNGTYTIKQKTEFKGFLKPEVTEVQINDLDHVIQVKNQPVSGILELEFTDKDTKAPIPGVIAEISQDGNLLLTVETDDDGTSESELPYGEYDVHLKELPKYTQLANEKEADVHVRVRAYKTITQRWQTVSPKYTVRLYPREAADAENIQTKSPRVTRDCDPASSEYVLLSGENHPEYAPGTMIAAFTDYSKKEWAYTLTVNIPGEYVIRETTPGTGYNPAQDITVCITEDQTEYDVPVMKEPISRNINIIKVDENNSPVGGAVIHAYRTVYKAYNPKKDPECREVLTDDNGSARIESLPFGEWVIECNGDPIVKTTINVGATVSQDMVIEFQGSKVPKFISVSVKDEKGSTVEGTSEFLLTQNGINMMVFEVQGEGLCHQSLPEGKYVLKQTGAPEAYTPAEEIEFEITEDTPDQQTIEVTDPPADRGLMIRVLKPSSQGDIEADNGKHYEYAEDVSILIKDDMLSDPLFQLRTTSDGPVMTTPIAPKDYLVFIADIPNGYYLTEQVFYINTAEDHSNSTDILLNPYPSEIALRLGETAGSGEEYGLYTVNREGEETGLELVDRTSSNNGTVVFNGTYPQGEYAIQRVSGEVDERTTYLTITPGSRMILEETATNETGLTVRVIDHVTGEALENAYIRIIDINNEYKYEGYVSGDGQWIALDPGEYRMVAVLAPEGYAINGTESHVSIQPDGEVSGDPVLRLEENRICVSVKDQDGAAVPGAVMAIVNRETKESLQASTDENGIAAFAHVAFGNYEISEVFPAPGYTHSKDQFRVTVDGIYENPVATPVITTKANHFGFKVVDYEGKPVEHAELALVNSHGSILQNAVTDHNGMAGFTSIPYGAYSVSMNTVPEQYLCSKTVYNLLVSNGGDAYKKAYTFVCLPREVCLLLLDQNSNRVPGATFELVDKDTALVTATKETDMNGEIVFREFGYGEYIIRETYSPNKLSIVPEYNLTIDKYWFPYQKIVFRSTPGYFEMKAINSKGEPLSDILFGIVNTQTMDTNYSITDASGIARFTGLSEGNYEIHNDGVPDEYVASKEVVRVNVDASYTPPEKLYMYMIQSKEN